MNDAVEIMQNRRRARLLKEEYCSLVADGCLSVGISAIRMGISEAEFEQMMKEWQEQGGKEAQNEQSESRNQSSIFGV